MGSGAERAASRAEPKPSERERRGRRLRRKGFAELKRKGSRGDASPFPLRPIDRELQMEIERDAFGVVV